MGTPNNTMKFLVLATCLSVSAAQGFFGLQGHPNGAITPIDEPRVAAARADHLATKFGAGPVLAAAPLAAAPLAAAPGAVVPLDEPAVAAARADHLAVQGATYAAAAPIV